MRILTTMLKQNAVYWAPGSPAVDAYGSPSYTTLVQIDCRWEDKREEYIDDQGTRQVSRAVVYVDRDLVVGGVLFNGGSASVTDADDPKKNTGAYEIKGFDKLPTLKGNKFLRTAFL